MVDGLFERVPGDGGQDPEAHLRLHEATALTSQLLQDLQHTVGKRVLRHFHRHGLLEPHEAEDMLTWDHGGGFSLDARVRLEAADRTGQGVASRRSWSRAQSGNDDEWHYVPVRRFFLFVEESVEESTQWVVFEPNDGRTWGRAGGRVEDFLVLRWREGALQGTTPEEAFCVRADG